LEDERELVLRAAQRDEAAFTRIYDNYFDRIFHYLALRIGNRTEAEDLTQQVFVKVARSITSFSWKGPPFSAWLFRIAHNQMVDYLRRNEKKRSLPLPDDIVSHENPQQTAETNLEVARVFEAAKKLTDAQQEVISLRFSSDLPTREVARIMGKSVGAIKALQHSAIMALCRVLEAGQQVE